MSGTRSTLIPGLALCALVAGSGLAVMAVAAPPKTTAKTAKATPPTKAKTAPASTKANKAGTTNKMGGAGGPVFVDNTPLTEDQKILHALNRIGFGPRPGDVARVKKMGLDSYIAQQLAPEKIDDSAVEQKLAAFEALQASPEELAQAYREQQMQAREIKRMQAEREAQKKTDGAMAENGAPGAAMTPPGVRPEMAAPEREMRARMRAMMQGQAGKNYALAGGQLQMAKITRAIESPRQLQEVLVDFWSNHFNIDIRKGLCRVYKITDDRDAIRPHTLGTFRELLGASAKSPAMLFYLDNAQSQAPQPVNPRLAQLTQRRRNNNAAPGTAPGAPAAPAPPQRARGGINENYAREIMELHTLGVDGGYTQKDVQEVARCLTGWGINRQTGTFEFNPRRHDDGEKMVLGHKIPAGGGIQDGETVLDILASHPSTARFVSRKLCQRFVADEPPAALVSRCAAVWAKTGGDLREVVRTIVTSPEFYSRVAYRQKIKSPFELAVSSVRALDGTVELFPGRAARAGLNRPAAARGAGGQLLVGQIATMGQPLFQYQAPTGYSEDSRKWVSSGALISRLNFTLGLVSGRVPGVSLESVAALTTGAQTPAEAVNRLADSLLHGEISPSTRATLLKQIEETPSEGSDAFDTTANRRTVALVLGSPEFQRR